MVRRLICLAFALVAAASTPSSGQVRSPLAPVPNWQELEQFHETITAEEFTRLLETVYAPGGAYKNVIEITSAGAVIKTSLTPLTTLTLRFASSAQAAKPVPRFWREASALPAIDSKTPLSGLKIAIDPGHLGGQWARMEERFFQIGDSTPVMEGEMTLRVAELMEPKLRELGAEVTMLRRATEPVTTDRPETLREAARGELTRQGVAAPREIYVGPDDPTKGGTVQWQSELLFYRISEIRRRAQIVNEQIRPDLTICLHFNAEAWGDPRKPEFVPRNHFHVLLNGSYSASELRNQDVRFDMLVKLLTRCLPEEAAVSTAVAESFARATGLPPFTYTTPNAVRMESSAYVWARNLLANRLYRTPVVFMEPYVMNSQEVWERVQAGEYEGERMVAGQRRKSIYREYADAMVNALKEHYTIARSSGTSSSSSISTGP
jgi:hypothetical protein